MTGPWTFDESVQACRGTSIRQAEAEERMREAAKTLALADEKYRIELAKEIVRQHADDGVAWTVAPDLARGNPTVAGLRRDRDIAEGLRDATQQEAWRRAADRKDAARYADWSQRVGLREDADAGHTHNWTSEPVIGQRRAA
jgi:hypothetical protein